MIVLIHLSTIEGHIPYDGEQREEIVTIATPVTTVLSFLNVCGIICAVVCLLFNIIFRNKRFLLVACMCVCH